MHMSRFAILLTALLAAINAAARSYLVEPQWQTGKSDFREAYVDENGNLTDYYTLQGSDTVNVFDVGADEYDLDISLELQNCHNEPYATYVQYYRDEKGQKRKAKERVQNPIYGWVWGMRDMQHYNAVLMRNADTEESVYSIIDVEYCVVTVDENDTTYHTPWTSYYLNMTLSNMRAPRFWLQYRNHTVWIGGGENYDIPWTVLHNIPCFGRYTGLYLGSAAKVKVSNPIIAVNAKERPAQTGATQASLADYFASHRCSPIEGFWDIETEHLFNRELKMGGKYRLGIIADGDGYRIIYLSGARIYPGKWKEGMVKGRLTPNSWGRYDLTWYDAEGVLLKDLYAELRGNTLILDFGIYDATLILTRNTEDENPANMPRTAQRVFGTGFAIHADGYVATNCHVVKGCNTIYLHSTDNRFPSPLRASVVICDEANDLAILKITDRRVTHLGELPYRLAAKSLERGEEVFCLGYPNNYLLGNEIKVSQGIITALNGLSPAQYMVSLDIDHGSSGSPVFDKKGNIAGIITAVFNREYVMLTASLAVKSAYLLQLMQQTEIEPAPAQQQKELSPTEWIDAIAPYVFLIECY